MILKIIVPISVPTPAFLAAVVVVVMPSPFESIRILWVPSVSTIKRPSEPESITSAFVLPSIILSASGVDIVLQDTDAPEPPLVNTWPDEP